MKRTFPYASAVPEVELKRRDLCATRAGTEAAQPRIYESSLPMQHEQPAARTAFGTWTEARIKAFLDQRGEDFDDCSTFAALVVRAQECEFATGPPTQQTKYEASADDEDDPLEAFMAEINQTNQSEDAAQLAQKKAHLELDEDADNVADFLEARRQRGPTGAAAPVATDGNNSDEEVYAAAAAADDGAEAEYDMHDNMMVNADKKAMELLPPVDHDEIMYDDFVKEIYQEPQALKALSPAEAHAMRRQLGLRVTGFGPPNPVKTFAQCGFDSALLGAITRAGFKEPTAIQAQALPAALSGRDILAVAKTGSGKTAAFVLPLLVHIMDQPELEKGAGPIGVIAAPTRELAEQIHKEARKLAKPYKLRICAAFGGLSKYEQFKDLKGGSEMAVCTPGRLIDLLKMKACSMQRATYLALDEADRMFDMGFESQVRCIIGQIRPDRQTLLFSATMPRRMERLARDILISPLRITVGEVGTANEDIHQVVDVVADEAGRLSWLVAHLPAFIDNGDVIVFVSQKAKVDELTGRLKAQGCRAVAIHGDLDQHARMEALSAFKSGQAHVLVATDVASRGLDITTVRTVINYDPPKNVDAYVHRVGRTGRAGDKDGQAHSLLTPKDVRFAGELVQVLSASNQDVPQAVHDIAMKHSRFRKGQPGGKGIGAGRSRKAQVGGAGLGFGAPTAALGAPVMTGFAPAAVPAAPAEAGSMQGFARSNMEANDNLSSAPSAPGLSPAPPPFPPGRPPPAAPTAPAPVPHGPALSTQAVARDEVGQMRRGKFQSGFISSGTQGGDMNARATIVAPKQQPARSFMPAPVPVSALPFTPATSLTSPSFGAAPAALPSAGQALSAAQAIAARLSASVSGGAQPSLPNPPPGPTTSSVQLSAAEAPPERRRAPPEPEAASYNQQPYQYPAQPGAVASSGVPLASAAAQSSIAKAQQAASALFAQFQQQSFPQAKVPQPPVQPPISRPKWDAR
ncbi:hypothetical protein WJX74_010687 [Apatococcus lobatus]|uniref:RNA helicase n=1 Tax=Apatococcus lobatus TaxID=904363 RepID=A0AAW1Q381_9CHLO